MSNTDLDLQRVQKAVEALRQGQLVAFPTETVYGLGADASSLTALERLYRAKGRPTNHPVIVHLHHAEQLKEWAAAVSSEAKALAEAFWPGPMTLILPRARHVLDQVTGDQDTVGLRIPNHPLALSLLRSFGGGVAAPSANKFGKLSPTTAQDVAADFADEVAMVLDGGPCDVGIESTIVDVTTSEVRILRPGMILADHIEAVLGKALSLPGGKPAPRVSGGLPSHYAPQTKLVLVSSDQLDETVKTELAGGKKVALLSFRPVSGAGVGTAPGAAIVASSDSAEYARQLYRNLRKLDQTKSDLILVERVPPGGAWTGIADRLQRAASDQLQMRGETA